MDESDTNTADEQTTGPTEGYETCGGEAADETIEIKGTVSEPGLADMAGIKDIPVDEENAAPMHQKVS